LINYERNQLVSSAWQICFNLYS